MKGIRWLLYYVCRTDVKIPLHQPFTEINLSIISFVKSFTKLISCALEINFNIDDHILALEVGFTLIIKVARNVNRHRLNKPADSALLLSLHPPTDMNNNESQLPQTLFNYIF